MAEAPLTPARDARWVRAEETLWREVLAGVVLLPPLAAEPVVLDGSGAALWALLAEPVSVDEVARILGEQHDVEVPLVVAALLPVIDQLASIGAVRSVPWTVDALVAATRSSP